MSAAAAAVALITLLIYLVPGATRIPNISLLYLLAIIGTALCFGRASAVAASILAFLAFDFFFTKPHFTFTVSNPDEWLALCIFLLSATVTGQLTALLRARADEARQREREAEALAEASWAVASQVDRGRALAEVLRRLSSVVEPQAAAILVPDKDGQLAAVAQFQKAEGRRQKAVPTGRRGDRGDGETGRPRRRGDGETEATGRGEGLVGSPPPTSWAPAAARVPGPVASVSPSPSSVASVAPSLPPSDEQAVQFVLQHGCSIGWKGDSHHWEKALAQAEHPGAIYLPLTTESRVLGVLSLRLPKEQPITPQQRRVVESLANHAAVVLERDRLARAETQARALAEADRLKTALLSMVSHDFRTPLASIKASATALLEGGAPVDAETQRELLTGIDQEADRLNRVVGNILALSRLEADAWRPQVEAIDPTDLVGTTLQAFAPDQNRRIHVSLDPDLAEVSLDPVQIVQVLHNLLDNALKYSPAEEPVELHVISGVGGRGAGRVPAQRVAESPSARPPTPDPRPPKPRALVIEVLDRGPGVLPGEEERIFERFYRSPRLQESAIPGVGIGLAVCRGLVEAHGGRLTMRHRDGGGSLFRLTLPQEMTR